jgi:hypothetical protein
MRSDSVGQGFRWARVESLSPPHYLNLSLLLAWTSFNCQLEYLHVASPHGLVWATLQHSIWVPRGRISRGQHKNVWHFYDLPLKVTGSHFDSWLYHRILSSSRGDHIDLITQWEECQGHTVQRICRMGNTVRAVLENMPPCLSESSLFFLFTIVPVLLSLIPFPIVCP